MPDYMALAERLDAQLIDYRIARETAGPLGRLLDRIGGPNLTLAWACFLRRRHHRVIFTDGEQIGLPLALLLKLFAHGQRPRHVMIAHFVSAPKKRRLLDRFGLQRQIDRFLVYSSWQQRFIMRRWGLPAVQVPLTPFMVDAEFFDPGAVQPRPQPCPQICAVGQERRDYPTLLRAVAGMPITVALAVGSPWSKYTDSSAGQTLPANVRRGAYTHSELRQLIADSAFVVIPLEPVEFQAGVTSILEAMAMGKAVICTRTPGQTDVIVHGEHGLYVPPGDSVALREAIAHLLSHPEEAARMGGAGRRLVERSLSLRLYVERLRGLVEAMAADAEERLSVERS